MGSEGELLLAFSLGLAATFFATPVAISAAVRSGFYDRPIGYKRHAAPTPYLGGAAVLGGFLLGTTTTGEEFGAVAPIVGCAVLLWALGTIDDRVTVRPSIRVLAEI